MGKLFWYKRDPDAALGGMMGLTLEERGAYNTVLDLIYSRADQLPDDDRFLAGWCNCDLRVWRRLKARLLELGKITIEGGMIRNSRATSGVHEALSRVEVKAEAARARWAKSKPETSENNNLADAQAPIVHMTSTTTTRSKEESSSPARAREAEDAAFTAWQEAATAHGWPDAQFLNSTRRYAIGARLAECGGLDGWRQALAKAADSKFIIGQDGKPQRWFDLDWLLKPANFIRLYEGRYAERHAPQPAGQNQGPSGQPKDRAFRSRMLLASAIRGDGDS